MDEIFTDYGIRGNIDGNLGIRTSFRLGKALGHYLDGNVAVMTDGCESSNIVKHSIISGLMALGCNIFETEPFPSEAFHLFVRDEEKFSGGIIVADPGCDGRIELTCIFSDGEEMVEGAMDKIQSYFADDVASHTMKEMGALKGNVDPIPHYISSVLSKVDPKAIKEAGIKIVLDCCNTVSSKILVKLLSAMELEIITLDTAQIDSVRFEDRVEDVRSIMLSHKYSMGVVADESKLHIITNEGELLSDDDVFAILAKGALTKAAGAIVATAFSSMTVDDVVDNYGGRIARSKVGSVNIIDRMKDSKSLLGGDEGRFIFSEHQYCYDMGMAMAAILDCVVRFGPLHNQYSMLSKHAKVRVDIRCPENIKSSAMDALHEIHAMTASDVDGNIYIKFRDCTIRVIYAAEENIVSLVCEPGKGDEWKGRMDSVESELRKFIDY